MYGEKFDLQNNDKILSINSPRRFLGGPYVVVHKNTDERWAIVALDWEEEPRLGMRWFWGNAGNPFSSAHPTWLVIPPALNMSILSGLPLDLSFRKNLENYLRGEISGSDL